MSNEAVSERSTSNGGAREWRTVDKGSWGPGPWQNEPDKMQWTDEATGLPCLIVRNPGGALCGYVGVGPAHRLHGVGYGDESDALGEALRARLEQPLGDAPSFSLMLACLGGDVKPTPDSVFQVHGGITFADRCASMTRETWGRWCENMRGRADEAKRYPQGESAERLHALGHLVDDFDAWRAYGEAAFICHVTDDPNDSTWWFGFDCAHAGDVSPKYDRRIACGLGGEVYRDVGYVRAEITRLAAQLNEVR